jgi:hypothetical protein
MRALPMKDSDGAEMRLVAGTIVTSTLFLFLSANNAPFELRWVGQQIVCVRFVIGVC